MELVEGEHGYGNPETLVHDLDPLLMSCVILATLPNSRSASNPAGGPRAFHLTVCASSVEWVQ